METFEQIVEREKQYLLQTYARYPVALASGLQMAGGVMDPKKSTLALLKMVSLARSSDVEVPAFAGPTTYQHARRVPTP